MNIQDYCNGIEQELSVWELKLIDLRRKVDRLSSGDKHRMLASVEDIHIVVTQLSGMIKELCTECPSEWRA